MNYLSISEKIGLFLTALNENKGILFMGSVFIAIGSILLYIGLLNKEVALSIFGIFFICFSLFFLLFTMPSSIAYYYEQALAKKYGTSTNATLIAKETIDQLGNHATEANHEVDINYQVTFSFEYKDNHYEASEFIDKQTFDVVNLGDSIPITFLNTKPSKAKIRSQKLKNKLTQTIETNWIE